jgi:hypothetical protein
MAKKYLIKGDQIGSVDELMGLARAHAVAGRILRDHNIICPKEECLDYDLVNVELAKIESNSEDKISQLLFSNPKPGWLTAQERGDLEDALADTGGLLINKAGTGGLYVELGTQYGREWFGLKDLCPDISVDTSAFAPYHFISVKGTEYCMLEFTEANGNEIAIGRIKNKEGTTYQFKDNRQKEKTDNTKEEYTKINPRVKYYIQILDKLDSSLKRDIPHYFFLNTEEKIIGAANYFYSLCRQIVYMVKAAHN